MSGMRLKPSFASDWNSSSVILRSLSCRAFWSYTRHRAQTGALREDFPRVVELAAATCAGVRPGSATRRQDDVRRDPKLDQRMMRLGAVLEQTRGMAIQR